MDIAGNQIAIERHYDALEVTVSSPAGNDLDSGGNHAAESALENLGGVFVDAPDFLGAHHLTDMQVRQVNEPNGAARLAIAGQCPDRDNRAAFVYARHFP